MAYQYRKPVVGLLLAVLLTACNSEQQSAKQNQLSYSDSIMGTMFNIKIPELPKDVNHEQLKAEIMSLLVEIDGQMSTYKQDSELSKINANTTRDKIVVSAALFEVLTEAQRISALSAGAFDITVGPLVNLWGFGSDKTLSKPPSEQLIKQALQKTGYDSFLLDQTDLAIKKLKPEIYLDLSALAKGYAVDQVAKLLESKQVSDFLVEIGGELNLKGHNSDKKAWRIAVEKPTADSRSIQTVIAVTDIAIASSGDYRNFFEQDGRRYSHTINPRTGWPISHNLISVTVLSNSTMTADALATAFMVLGAEQGLALAEQEKIAALFFLKSDNGLIEKSSTAYQNYFKVRK